MKKSCLRLTLLLGILFASSSYAEDYVLTIKDHQFSPRQLEIPAGQKVKITVKNEDETPAEFESSDLNREKIISAKSQIIVYVGPLSQGSYSYFDEFNRESATGTIIVK
jgi:hypothetical protein